MIEWKTVFAKTFSQLSQDVNMDKIVVVWDKLRYHHRYVRIMWLGFHLEEMKCRSASFVFLLNAVVLKKGGWADLVPNNFMLGAYFG